MKANISSERFILRTISPELDSFKNYLSWMQDEVANEFILSINKDTSLEELHDYVSAKNASNTALLLGIYTNSDSEHLGNIKLEPIISGLEATVGVLIGEQNWRGKGVGFEVLSRIIQFSFNDLELTLLRLGIDRDNMAAYNLYRKLGFQDEVNNQSFSNTFEMTLKK